MIQCKKCNAVILNTAKYCTECGHQVSDNIKFCPECHSDVPEGAKFCLDCGGKVATNNSKSISAFFLIIILIGTGLVIFRSLELPQKANNKAYITNANTSDYEEESFHTMVFKDKPRHEVQLNIYSPTTQALISEHINEWLVENLSSNKVKSSDEIRINAFEKNKLSGESNLRAKFIRVDLEANPNYNFPDGEYSNVGDSLYVEWIAKQNT